MTKNLVKIDSCLVCESNPFVKCGLCEPTFHKTCTNITQYQFKEKEKNVFTAVQPAVRFSHLKILAMMNLFLKTHQLNKIIKFIN